MPTLFEGIVIKQQSRKVPWFHPFLGSLFLLLPLSAYCSAQTNVPSDQGGAVFNVMAYGAIGDGSTNDTVAIQNAINAATTARGGIVYFPAGNYVLKQRLTSKRSDLVSLVGSGMGTQLIVNIPLQPGQISSVGISLAPVAGIKDVVHGGRIQAMTIYCTHPATDIAIQMTDMAGASPQLNDLTISNCNQGVDLINQNSWTERITVNNLTDYYNNHLFHYDQAPGNKYNSYGYGIYGGIYINKRAGQDVFYLTGGAYLYHSTFVVKGNLEDAKNASIYNIQGGSGEPCSGAAFNVYDIATEGDSYFVVKTSPNGCRPGPTGSALVSGIGMVSAAGATAIASPGSLSSISDPQQASYLAVPGFIATDSSSDTVSAANVTPATKCHVQPTDAISANATRETYVSGTNWQTVTIKHPPTARGGRFQVWCTP